VGPPPPLKRTLGNGRHGRARPTALRQPSSSRSGRRVVGAGRGGQPCPLLQQVVLPARRLKRSCPAFVTTVATSTRFIVWRVQPRNKAVETRELPSQSPRNSTPREQSRRDTGALHSCRLSVPSSTHRSRTPPRWLAARGSPPRLNSQAARSFRLSPRRQPPPRQARGKTPHSGPARR
jgi:hypothetical protein